MDAPRTQPGSERNARELDLRELAAAIAARKRRETRQNGAVVPRARRITRGGAEHIGDRTVDRTAATLTWLTHADGTRELATAMRPDGSGWASPVPWAKPKHAPMAAHTAAARADEAQAKLAAQHAAKLAARRALRAGTAAYRMER